MNRHRKEEIRKYQEAREGLTTKEIEELDRQEAYLEKVGSLANELHHKLFPEEYDHMYDSISDANDRSRGICPMNPEYIKKVQARRAELGVDPLVANGLPVSNESYALCRKLAEERLSASDSNQ